MQKSVSYIVHAPVALCSEYPTFFIPNWIKVGNDYVTIMFESLLYILYVNVLIGEFNNLTVILISRFSVDTANGKNLLEILLFVLGE
jgi:hypothetical protein